MKEDYFVENSISRKSLCCAYALAPCLGLLFTVMLASYCSVCLPGLSDGGRLSLLEEFKNQLLVDKTAAEERWAKERTAMKVRWKRCLRAYGLPPLSRLGGYTATYTVSKAHRTLPSSSLPRTPFCTSTTSNFSLLLSLCPLVLPLDTFLFLFARPSPSDLLMNSVPRAHTYSLR